MSKWLDILKLGLLSSVTLHLVLDDVYGVIKYF